MNFDRVDLIAKIDKKLKDMKDMREKAAQQSGEIVKAYENAKQDWIRKHSNAWTNVALAIQDKIAKGQVITAKDLEPVADSRFGRFTTFDYEPPKPKKPPEEKVARLTSLRDALELSTDKTVSDSTISRMGWTISELF